MRILTVSGGRQRKYMFRMELYVIEGWLIERISLPATGSVVLSSRNSAGRMETAARTGVDAERQPRLGLLQRIVNLFERRRGAAERARQRLLLGVAGRVRLPCR